MFPRYFLSHIFNLSYLLSNVREQIVGVILPESSQQIYFNESERTNGPIAGYSRKMKHSEMMRRTYYIKGIQECLESQGEN